MSTNHTPNYNLSQWEPSDAVRREDFNADNAKIDAALKAMNTQVSGMSSSVTSHTSSIAKKGNCQVYVSTYTGDGGTSKTLSFPGYPVFVFIQVVGYPAHITFIRTAECGAGDYGNVWAVPTWSSRSLTWQMANGSQAELNSKGSQYAVFALLNMSA